MNIYVGNLSYDLSEDDLKEAFSAHGNVTSVNIITDKYTNRSKGFGFVEMSESSEATQAIEAINGQELKGRAVKVNEARPREDRN